MKQLVVIACLVVTLVAAVRKEVTRIKIFLTKINIFVKIIIFTKIIILIAIVINIFVKNHHLDQHSCQDQDCDLHHDLGGADGRGQDELELGVQR